MGHLLKLLRQIRSQDGEDADAAQNPSTLEESIRRFGDAMRKERSRSIPSFEMPPH